MTLDQDAVTAIIGPCFCSGLLVIRAGLFGNVIRFLPPMVMTDEQALEIFAVAITEVLE
jgi:4-aminobutyrate aminotransferase / (S)-3-amino-2-methylpropionate transaminase / 5-aminovalerate transaminase